MANSQRLGIDIGGTFTDFVMMDEGTGQFGTMKVPSRPADPAAAVMEGINRLVEGYGVEPSAISYFVHGTTIALNTLIQRTGARTGLLITRGFRDVLEIGRLRLPNPNDYTCERTPPLVPRQWVQEVDERMLASGEVLTPLDLDQFAGAVDALIAEGVEAVAVCFLHAYRNDAHERAAIAFLRERYPSLYAAGSAATWPEQREFERSLVTVMNAYLGRQLHGYFSRLHRVAGDLGLNAVLFTTKSNGGLMTAQSASESPVQTLFSGPASGVVGAHYVAGLAGFPQVISLDIGGTSADAAIIDGAIPYSTDGHVGEFPVIMPTVEISSIGAGGGSIAWTDAAGVLKVGPRSAGADPGPICYGRGGTEPTVTDAYVTLGIIDPSHFLGGRMRLDAAAAWEGMAGLGNQLGQDAIETASSVLAVLTANMYAQLLPIMARRGADPRDFTLVAYGGAGPTQGCLLAKELEISRVLVPRHPGLLCAFGSLVMDLKSDFIATISARTDHVTIEQLESHFSDLEAQAKEWLRSQGHHGTYAMVRTADMRYKGQSFEINVALQNGRRHMATMDEVLDAFHNDYEAVYTHSDRSAPAEVVNVRVTVSGDRAKPEPARVEVAAAGDAPPVLERRRVFLEGEWVEADVYHRASLLAGHRFRGPAVVEQDDTTTLLPPGTSATVDGWANLVVEVEA